MTCIGVIVGTAENKKNKSLGLELPCQRRTVTDPCFDFWRGETLSELCSSERTAPLRVKCGLMFVFDELNRSARPYLDDSLVYALLSWRYKW